MLRPRSNLFHMPSLAQVIVSRKGWRHQHRFLPSHRGIAETLHRTRSQQRQFYRHAHALSSRLYRLPGRHVLAFVLPHYDQLQTRNRPSHRRSHPSNFKDHVVAHRWHRGEKRPQRPIFELQIMVVSQRSSRLWQLVAFRRVAWQQLLQRQV